MSKTVYNIFLKGIFLRLRNSLKTQIFNGGHAYFQSGPNEQTSYRTV